MTLRALSLAVIVLSSACADLAVDPPQRSVAQAIGGGGCQEWMCGTNSPLIANFGFWDLAIPTTAGVLGKANTAGLQIAGFYKATSPSWSFYLPRVVAGKLRAFPGASNAPPNNVELSGASLVDGFFLIWTPSGWFKLWVKGIGRVASWAQPPGTLPGRPSVFLESYLLDWSDLSGERLTNVCSNPGERDELGMNGPLSFQTLLFEGDRIDAGKKAIYDVDNQWFNFGCAGSTLAKMALTGHTEASKAANTFATTLSERQTMLKMLTADYCGDGTPYTVAGQPLNWADDHRTMAMIALTATPPRPVVREARWGPEGPLCLDKPRVDAHWTQLGKDTFGTALSVYEQVKQHCPAQLPPACSGSALGLDGAHLITATEPLAPPP